MISAHLSTLLSNLGWGSGFRLPVANDENKILENLLEEKQRKLLELNGSFEVDSHHCDILNGHLDRMAGAVKQAQKMITAKRTGLESEHNLKGLAERMESRIKNDYRSKREDIKEYKKRNQRMSDEVDTRRRIVEDLIATVRFDQEALEKYKQVLDDKESYIEYVRTLEQLDERQFAEFQLRYGKAGEELNHSRRVLLQTSGFTQTLQQQFSRLCGQFRRVHNERGQAISFWENTLKSMQQRDEDIKVVAEEYAIVRSRVHDVDAQCERSQAMLMAEKNNQMNLDYQIKSSDKACGVFRMRLTQGKEHTMSLNDEILTFNTIINQTSRIVKEVRAKIENHQNELNSMQKKLENAQKELNITKNRYETAMLDTMSEESRTKEFEKMIEQEEQRTEALIQEIEKQRRYLWQRSNDLNFLERKYKTVKSQIKGTKTIIVSLRDRVRNDDTLVAKRRQQAYHLELEVLALESRIQSMLSSAQQLAVTSGAGDVLALKDKLMDTAKAKTFLTAQQNHLKNVNKRMQMEIGDILRDHHSLKHMVDNQILEAQRFGVDNIKTMDFLKDLRVETRLLHMTLKRIYQIDEQERMKMMGLEQDRSLIEAAAKERRAEIELHMNVLRSQQKSLREDRNKLAAFVVEILTNIERCKTRYEYVINAMNLYGEEGGHSESYYILKHAQERETLKREGDLWDAKVKECEKEIAALQNTLSILVSSNVAFRDSLSPASGETPEAKMLMDMENEQKIALVRKRKATRRVTDLTHMYHLKQSEYSEAGHLKMYLEGLLAEKKYELNNVHFEVVSQKSKIDRANKQSARLIKELGLHVHDDRETIEADLKLRCAREKFEYGLKTLEKNLFLYHELRHQALDFLTNNGLDFVLPRIRKRIAAKDAQASPYHSGQVTPIRYLTPISSADVLQPFQARQKERLAEFRRLRERPDLPLLVQPSASTSANVTATGSQQKVAMSPGLTLAAAEAALQEALGEVEEDLEIGETSTGKAQPGTADTTTIFKALRDPQSTSELDVTHPTDAGRMQESGSVTGGQPKTVTIAEGPSKTSSPK